MPTHMDANALIISGVICLGPFGVVTVVRCKRRMAVWHGGDSVSAYLPDTLDLAVVLRRFDLMR